MNHATQRLRTTTTSDHQAKPFNFRMLQKENRPQACQFAIAGFASPKYKGHGDHLIPKKNKQPLSASASYTKAVNYLKKNEFKIIISFEEHFDSEFQQALEPEGMQYMHIPMAGRHCHNSLPIHSPKLLDEIYQYIVSANSPVAMHCIGGMGRTGTHLAALLLRRKIEDLTSQPKIDWDLLLKESKSKTASAIPSNFITSYCKGVCDQTPIIACTALVAEVINDLRALETTSGTTAHFGVESAIQIQSLCEYQQYLLNHF
ncbi:MAG: protein-tyrosine phosphatase family protein [Coxiellaceae bacterium]|nr:protein-tyrosine phosphatase family protein [Coxiellaceae bacterium]